MHLTRPDGTLPSLGDDDGGRALALDKRNYRSFQDGLCLGAVLTSGADFKHQAGAFFEEALWMLGEGAWDVYRALKSQEPAETQRLYLVRRLPDSALRLGARSTATWFSTAAGSAYSPARHAHADALSVILFSGGHELLVDPGTFVYNCAPEWRRYFRSTRAHNTVTIDQPGSGRTGGDVSLEDKTIFPGGERTLASLAIEYVEARARWVSTDAAGQWCTAAASCHVPPEYWIVVDDFRGSGEHTFDFHYHFAPDVEISKLEHDEAGVLVRAERAGLQLGLIADRPFAAAGLIHGEVAPIGGWVSRGYGEKRPGHTLRATLAGAPPAAAMAFVVVAPGRSCGPVVRQLTLEHGSGIACSYQHDGFDDIAVLSTGDSEIGMDDFRMSGEFFWLRLQSGLLKQVLAARALALNHRGHSIFQNSEPGPYWSGMQMGGATFPAAGGRSLFQ